MRRLPLRQLPADLAQASRALGAGVALAFSARGLDGELQLLPALPGSAAVAADASWLESAVGPLCLSDAGAVLSLLGELPVTLGGDEQLWYWQLLSQQLSPALAASLQLLAPAAQAPEDGPLLHARVHVRLGAEQLWAALAAPPQSWLNWLQAPAWRRLHSAVHEQLKLQFPVELGQLQLSAEQLASLQPGDIVLPTQTLFDCAGQGALNLAQQRWGAQLSAHGERLFLNLRHEESGHHEH